MIYSVSSMLFARCCCCQVFLLVLLLLPLPFSICSRYDCTVRCLVYTLPTHWHNILNICLFILHPAGPEQLEGWTCTKRRPTMSVPTIAPISVKEFAGMMQLVGPLSTTRWSKTLGTCTSLNRVQNAETSK